MTARNKDLDRKIVPRWHSLAAAGRQAETASATRGDEFDEVEATPFAVGPSLRKLTVEWQQNQSVPFAADLVAASLAGGRTKEAEDAARYLIRADERRLPQELARR